MKHLSKTTVLILTAVTLLLSTTSVLAIAKVGNFSKVGTTYETIASDPNGIGREIAIHLTTAVDSKCDIRALGKNGNTVWEKKNEVGSTGKTVFCDSSVSQLQIRATSSKTISGYTR